MHDIFLMEFKTNFEVKLTVTSHSKFTLLKTTFTRNAFWSLYLSFEAIKSFIFIKCTKKCISTNLWLVHFPVTLVDVMHHLPTGSLAYWTSERFFLSNYVMLLRKAFKLACNGSNLSKGRAGNSILLAPCLLLSKQERGTSKKEKLNSNLVSQYMHLVFGVI